MCVYVLGVCVWCCWNSSSDFQHIAVALRPASILNSGVFCCCTTTAGSPREFLFFSPSGFLEILRPCHCWPLGDRMVKGLAHPQGCKTRHHKEQSQRRASSVKVCWVPLGKNGFFKSCSYAFWESYRFLFYSVCIVLHVCQASFTRIPVYSLCPGTLLGVRCAA